MSRAGRVRTAIRYATYLAALGAFLVLEGLVWGFAGFIAVMLVGTAISMAVFERMASPEERAEEARRREERGR